MKTIPFIILTSIVTLLFSASICAQTDNVKVVLKVRGEIQEVKDLQAFLILSSNPSKKLELKTDGCSTIFASHNMLSRDEEFDVRLTFGKFDLLFTSLNASHFDTEWIVDIQTYVGVLSENDQSTRSKNKVLRAYSIDFHPSNREATSRFIVVYEK